MSGVPILVEASALRVLIVGGGAVGARKARQFSLAGAEVRVIAPAFCEDLEHLITERGLVAERRAYESGDVGNAHLVFAATNDRLVNADVAREAEAGHRLLNAADQSEEGNFAVMAAHHRGPLTVGVSAGGVPAAAQRIRDAIAARFDARYGDALTDLKALRKRLIASGAAHLWRERSPELINEEFCDTVERGALSERIAEWP